jgi:hypothetical protein
LDLLLALLAFAVTMLVLATVVTTVVELIARLLRRRTRVFAQLLGVVFEKEIRPILKARLSAAGAAADRERREFANTIMQSPLIREEGWFSKLLGVVLPSAQTSDQLTSEEFLRRLARTEVGQQLAADASAQIQAVVERITRRYEEMCDAAREYFRNSSGVLSLVVGVAIAIGYNVDGLRILRYFIDNPQASAAMAANAERALENHKAAEQKLQATLKSLETRAAQPGAAKEDLESVKQVMEETKGSLESLRGQGLPIGLDYFPHCRMREKAGTKDPACERGGWGDGFLWLLAAFVSGLAIGLGGPFWYDAVTGLMRVSQMLRGRAPPADASAAAGSAAATPASPTDVFIKHVETRLPATGYAGPLTRPAPPAGDSH